MQGAEKESSGEGIEDGWTPRGEGEGKSGWVRIGRYDPVRRRALWARITAKIVGEHEHEVLSVELCAGREGDDAYVKVTPDNPIFRDLEDCIGRSISAVNGELHFAGVAVVTLEDPGGEEL